MINIRTEEVDIQRHLYIVIFQFVGEVQRIKTQMLEVKRNVDVRSILAQVNQSAE